MLLIGVDELHGGMKTYRGSPAAARHYVEADRGRADDYYLAEGTGIAQRYVAAPDTGVRQLQPLTGDKYETWVAGCDPDTGAPKGRLRTDEAAVRFVEVVVNGPKSWSLAAELHPDISVAYDAAQDRAATQIVSWLARHASTRVGPRGAQVQVPVAEIEAVTVRHYTSRAGDPHRHLHLQINARVQAEGSWRGLHTVGVRDSLDAINGIGHAAVMTDPAFRAALAAHGFTLNPESGEVTELAEFVGPFSARAGQIGRNIDRYEADWRAANPAHEPGPTLRRAWDARAWADGRPDKILPRDGADLTRRWVTELRALGYRDIPVLASIDALPVGQLDRQRAVAEVLTRLAARRSGWNAADIRGEVEQLIARRNLVTEASVRGELAEDLTARARAKCVPLLDRAGVPEHIRALTSRHVLDVEADLTARLAARANAPSTTPSFVDDSGHAVLNDALAGLDTAQRDVVAALAGDAALLVVEGAAGAGKTTTLAAGRVAIQQRGAALMVVTPTLKAAHIAAQQIGSRASSAAWLAYQHGYRWNEDGLWTRLEPGQLDPRTNVVFVGPNDAAMLRPGDVLLVDEAGMLDQDTARALLTIADEHHARVALVGDRHQLPAVGRGGVLDLAARWATPEACLTLDTVHRFTRTLVADDGKTVTVADTEYARLSLAMRTGTEPEVVFDALVARDQIRVHANEGERVAALAEAAAEAIAAGSRVAAVADTREQVAELNAAIRERLIATGHVDDQHATTTNAGLRIGVGDRVATRRNDRDLGVANRDTWTVTHVATDGWVTVAREGGERMLPAGYVREHLELAYASTVHGVQGETATTAHASLGEQSTAASAYVAMTRGRDTNTAHLVADTVEEAREQWVAIFARERADLGPAHAGDLAASQASRYAQLRPLDQVLGELHRAWSVEADCRQRLADAEQRREHLAEILSLTRERDATAPALGQAYRDARAAAEHATVHADRLEVAVSEHTAEITEGLQRAWDEQRNTARQAAQTVRNGSGRLGQRRAAVNRATEELTRWSATWQPYLPTMPTRTEEIVAFAAWFDDTPTIHAAFDRHARTDAEHTHPNYQQSRDAADAAVGHRDDTWRAWLDTDTYYRVHLAQYGNLAHIENPAGALADVEHTITSTTAQLSTAQTTVAALLAEPTLRSQPGDRLTTERNTWRVERDTRARNQYAHNARVDADIQQCRHDHQAWVPHSRPEQSPGIHR
ncbi:MAG: relaxase domain-containing protein [Actinomycetota bacterium]|nr:relaxase domain-containing protein [Actinomycetota bacterium]